MKFIYHAILIIVISLPALAENKISLPVDYKNTFTEYLSLDRTQNHNQFMRLYANDLAMKGRDKDGNFLNGSQIVAEVYGVKTDSEGKVITSRLNRRIKDKLKLLAVMEKQNGFEENSGSAIKTGDWDFATFKPNGKVAPKNLDSCRSCHTPLTDTDFLFSADHLPSATTY